MSDLPFILHGALHFARNEKQPGLFLDWYSRLLFEHPDTKTEISCSFYQPENLMIYICRIKGSYSTLSHLQQGCNYIATGKPYNHIKE